MIGGNLACFAANGFIAYVLFRFVAGVGGGLATFAYGELAKSNRPERSFAILSAATVVMTSAAGALAPWLTSRLGTNSLFALMAALGLLALPGIRALTGSAKEGAQINSRGHYARIGWRALGGAALMLLFFMPLSAYWVYVEQLGYAGAAHATATAAIVSSGFLVSATAGNMVAMSPLLHLRRVAVIGVAAVGCTVSIFATVLMPSLVAYTVAVYSFIFCWFLAMPFLMGVLSAVDPSGRLSVAGIIVETLGFAIGPALGATLLEHRRYIGFCIACGVAFGLSVVSARATLPSAAATTA